MVITSFVSELLITLSLDPFKLVGKEEITHGQKFGYSILIIVLLVLCTGVVYIFWFKRRETERK